MSLQVGFATRLRDGGTTFYARHGGSASLFGHMTRDARGAVDLLACLTPAGRANGTQCGDGENHHGAYPSKLARIPAVDPTRIFVAGYSLGGNVALHAAALDSRLAGAAAFAASTPYRGETADKPTGGLRRLYEMHGLLPRLGARHVT